MGKGHFRIIPEHIVNSQGETAVIDKNKHWIIKGKNPMSFQTVQTKPPEKLSKRVKQTKDGTKKVYGRDVEVVNKTVISMVNPTTGENGVPMMNGIDVSGKYTLEQFRGLMRRGKIQWGPINPGRELNPDKIKKYYPDLKNVSVTF